MKGAVLCAPLHLQPTLEIFLEYIPINYAYFQYKAVVLPFSLSDHMGTSLDIIPCSNT